MSFLAPKNLTYFSLEMRVRFTEDCNRISCFYSLVQSCFQFTSPQFVQEFSAFLTNYRSICNRPSSLFPDFDKRLIVHLVPPLYRFIKYTKLSVAPDKVRLNYEIKRTITFLENFLESC